MPDFTDMRDDIEPVKDAPIAPAHGIAALALSMAMKWHDMGLVKDGVLYQQYKMEGKNIGTLHLDMVFDTAVKMEAHLLGSSERIAKLIVDAIQIETYDDEETAEPTAEHPSAEGK